MSAIGRRVIRSVSFRLRTAVRRLRKWWWRWSNREAIQEEFGSHLPILESLFDLFELERCLELGMGLSSTPLLLARASFLVSIEHDGEWFRRTVGTIDEEGRSFAAVLWHDAALHHALDAIGPRHYDLALVDSVGSSRVPCADRLLGAVDFLVLHDTEAECYEWGPFLERLRRDGHHFVTFRDRVPWTTVVCAREDHLRALIKATGQSPADVGAVFAPIR